MLSEVSIQENRGEIMQKNITATPLFLLEKLNDDANYHDDHEPNIAVDAI
ncbi:hypothetical protein ig2599ANME_0444 [groundwater metagenome]